MKRFYRLAILLIVGRIYDPLTTYYYTPDLSHESNPVGRLLGIGGWWGIIVTHSLVLAFVLYALWIYCTKKLPTLSPVRDMKMTSFISSFFYGNTTSFSQLLYKMPTVRHSLLYAIGYVVPMTLISISYIVGTSTLLLVLSPGWHYIYREWHISIFLWLLILILLLFFTFRFFSMEMKRLESLSNI